MQKFSSRTDVVLHSSSNFEILKEVDDQDREAPPPKDKLNLVFLVFLLNGVGVLLPWNLFINAKEYFEDYKLNTTTSADADYRKNFMNYIGIGSHLPNLLMSAFNVFFQPTRPTRQTGNTSRRIMLVILLEVAVCAVTMALALVDTSDSPRMFFDITILSVVVLNCCTGVYQSSVFGMAAMLPMSYSNAVVLGTNLCGTVVAAVNIVCKLASTKDMQLTAVCYFAFAILLLLICFGSVLLLRRLKFYQHHVAAALGCSNFDDNLSPKESQEAEGEADDSDNWCLETLETAAECFGCCCPAQAESRTDACGRYWLRYWLAFKDCWIHCLSVWAVFFCTLACFPAVQSNIRPLQLSGLSDWFTDIFVFLLFNLLALSGSFMSGFVQVPTPRWLWLAVWTRGLVCVPFFLLCNCFPDTRAAGFPVLITNDFVFIAGMTVFAFTSGYFSSLCMMYAPRDVSDAKFAGEAAMVATFFLIFGIFSGISFGGFLFNVIQQ